MKKLLALMLVVVTAFAFCACAKQANNSDSSVIIDGTATIVIHTDKDTEYVVSLSDLQNPATVFNAMQYLNEKKGVELIYTMSDAYGAYVTQFGNLIEDQANYNYVFFWTSVESDFGVGEWATEKTYNGVKLVASGVGVSTAKFEKDAVIYFAFN